MKEEKVFNTYLTDRRNYLDFTNAQVKETQLCSDFMGNRKQILEYFDQWFMFLFIKDQIFHSAGIMQY